MTQDEIEWNTGDKVIIKAELELAPKTRGKIYVDLWYTNIYELFLSDLDFSNLSDLTSVFDNKVVFQPRMITRPCINCTEEDS